MFRYYHFDFVSLQYINGKIVLCQLLFIDLRINLTKGEVNRRS